jgi:uncharacterized protein (TIGR02145 family)
MSATITNHTNAIQEVVIGTQTWTLRNYDFGGIAYDNNIDNIDGYGKLYTWDEAMAITLPGYHLPSQTEWETLITYLGGVSVAGGHIKESGTAHWTTPNTDADNSSGFTAIAVGNYDAGDNTIFYNINNNGIYWSSTESGGGARIYYALYNSAAIGTIAVSKNTGVSVRLIKD